MGNMRNADMHTREATNQLFCMYRKYTCLNYCGELPLFYRVVNLELMEPIHSVRKCQEWLSSFVILFS